MIREADHYSLLQRQQGSFGDVEYQGFPIYILKIAHLNPGANSHRPSTMNPLFSAEKRMAFTDVTT